MQIDCSLLIKFQTPVWGRIAAVVGRNPNGIYIEMRETHVSLIACAGQAGVYE